MTKQHVLVFVSALAMVVALVLGLGHARSGGERRAELAPAANLALASALMPPTTACTTDNVVESQDAASCTAGGWQPVVSGWGPMCCASTRRYIKFVGASTQFKCCGACPQ